MGRPPCCDKLNVKRGPWTAEEDAKILAYVASHGIGNWTLVPQKAGLNRCGKSCRLRWTNYLRPDLKHDSFTAEEEELILRLHEAIGSRWSLIAKRLPGRTDNDVKNYWNTKLRKKLTKMGIDPVTHKPFSQILTDFGNVSGLTNSRNQMRSFVSFMNDSRSMLTSQPSLVTTAENADMTNKPILQEQIQVNYTRRHSWNNVAPFQMVNNENFQPHLLSEVSSSNSPSSSSCVTVTPLSSPPSFSSQSSPLHMAPLPCSSSWYDFILGDPSFAADAEQQHLRELQQMLSPNFPSEAVLNETSFLKGTTGNGNGNCNGLNEVKNEKAVSCSAHYLQMSGDQTKNCSETASLAVDSFVDSILSHDHRMQLEFPQLSDGYFDY